MGGDIGGKEINRLLMTIGATSSCSRTKCAQRLAPDNDPTISSASAI